jgi:hypothetical protein
LKRATAKTVKKTVNPLADAMQRGLNWYLLFPKTGRRLRQKCAKLKIDTSDECKKDSSGKKRAPPNCGELSSVVTVEQRLTDVR